MSLSFFRSADLGGPGQVKPVVDGQYSAVGTISGARCGGRIFVKNDVGDVCRQTSPCGERLWERRDNAEFTRTGFEKLQIWL